MDLDYRALLQEEFSKKKLKNKSYSLRALSRDLNLSPSYLSQVLSGKKDLTRSQSVHFAQSLFESELEQNYFCKLVEFSLEENVSHKKTLKQELVKLKSQLISKKELTKEFFNILSHWYYGAIIELVNLKDFKSDPLWIAKKLGISLETTKIALEKLIKIQLLKIDSKGNLQKSDPNLSIDEVPMEAIRNFHKELIRKSLVAIDDQDPKIRDYHSLVLSLNATQIEAIKKCTRDYINSVVAITGEPNNPHDQIYNLSLQFFKIDH